MCWMESCIQYTMHCYYYRQLFAVSNLVQYVPYMVTVQFFCSCIILQHCYGMLFIEMPLCCYLSRIVIWSWERMHFLSRRVILLPLLLPTLMPSRISRRLELKDMLEVCPLVVQLTGTHYSSAFQPGFHHWRRTKRHLRPLDVQNAFAVGALPWTHGRAYSARLNPLAGGEGAQCLLSKKSFSAVGLEFRPFEHHRCPSRQIFVYAHGFHQQSEFTSFLFSGCTIGRASGLLKTSPAVLLWVMFLGEA